MQLTGSMTQEALQMLQNPSSAEDPSATLRFIKNNLTGHELRKIEYLQAGLIPALVDFLSNVPAPATGANETYSNPQKVRGTIWLHASGIISVIANSGAAFTYPILKSPLTQLLLDELDRTSNTRLELSILRCLNSIADNLPLESERDWTANIALARQIYTKSKVMRLARVITTEPKSHQQRQSTDAVLSLLCKTCTTEAQANILVEAQLLDILCNELARFITSSNISLWQGSRLTYNITCPSSDLSEKAPSLSLVLETIAVVVETSDDHSKTFVSHPALNEAVSAIPQSPAQFQRLIGDASQEIPTMVNIPLPEVPDAYRMNVARRSNFPPLSASSTLKRRTSSMRTTRQEAIILENDDKEEPGEYMIVPWLLYVVRASRGRRRLVAAKLLGLLKCHGFMNTVRARSLASLLVPILTEMLDKPGSQEHFTLPHVELVPSILALVVRDSETLQKAAVETHAIKKLASALKANFDPMQNLTNGLWWPEKLTRKLTEGDQEHSLGLGGPSRQMRISMQLREGLLQALASLASENENYRKEVIDQGILTQIIHGLEPFHSTIHSGDQGDRLVLQGNSPQVLIAACAAVRALTRSSTSLRTKLVDADVAKPIIKLLHTTEPEVRIAATMVMANLAHDFSPMKTSIEPVIRKLCEQAHSAHARLRLESLFTLKAMVNNSKNDLKKKIIEELGPNWIKQLIATDPHDVPTGEVIGLVPREYRKGSMIRVSVETEMDIDDESNLSETEHEDVEYTAHTLQQDLDIQAELLAFLRNLTTGEKPEEIIGFLLEHIGQDDFLQIIVDRLKTAIIQRPLALASPTEIASNSLYILTHLCAADRKYRQEISQNIVLMKQTSALLAHSCSGIRRAACWLVTNLVYANSNESFEMLLVRARELQKLGIMNQIRRMEKSDPIMDVKEGAATASECFAKLLDRT